LQTNKLLFYGKDESPAGVCPRGFFSFVTFLFNSVT